MIEITEIINVLKLWLSPGIEQPSILTPGATVNVVNYRFLIVLFFAGMLWSCITVKKS